jgi:CubicO group peptidase (beta-lactamase class C family)
MKHKILSLLALTVSLLRINAEENGWPGAHWPEATPAEAGLHEAKLQQAREYALSAGGSGLIIRNGKAVMHWGDQEKRYDIKSATKSIGSAALGIAIKDGKIALDAPAREYHPSLGAPPESNTESGWLDRITIRHLATHTAGFEKPGGFENLSFEPGTKWGYSDGGPNWLAECITLQYERDVQELLFDRIFARIGITRNDLRWRGRNLYRPDEIKGIPRREFGAGVHANVNALARIGLLYLRGGEWDGERILPQDYVAASTQPIQSVAGLPVINPEHGNASDHYGLLWWTNGDGALENVPRDAYWAWGLHDSIILVIPSLNLVAARGGESGKSWPREIGATHYDVLKRFFEPIVAAIENSGPAQWPYPPSPVIETIEWAPQET